MGDSPPQNVPLNNEIRLPTDSPDPTIDLPREELLRLYVAERQARIATDRRLDAALSDISKARKTSALRDYVMASAHCLLWYADIFETDEQYLNWIMEFPNIETARRF